MSMSDSVTARWEELLRSALRRYQLVFVQAGSAYTPLCHDAIAAASETVTTAATLARGDTEGLTEVGVLTVTEAEVFAYAGRPTGAASLGELRIQVEKLLELGIRVCLVSSAPRCAYPPIPGSSIIEDAKPFYFGLLEASEIPIDYRRGGDRHTPAAIVPAVSLLDRDIDEVFRQALLELGPNVLAAIDRAVFDIHAREEFPTYLDQREVDALLGAGLAARADDALSAKFSVPYRFSEFQSALADVMADIVDPRKRFPTYPLRSGLSNGESVGT